MRAAPIGVTLAGVMLPGNSFDAAQCAASADRIAAGREVLARSAVDRQYSDDPGLMARWGWAGYETSIRDALATVDQIAESVALGDPSVFERYLAWLRDVLEAAGVPAPVLVEHLVRLRAAFVELLPDAAEAGVAALLDNALRLIGNGGSP